MEITKSKFNFKEFVKSNHTILLCAFSVLCACITPYFFYAKFPIYAIIIFLGFYKPQEAYCYFGFMWFFTMLYGGATTANILISVMASAVFLRHMFWAFKGKEKTAHWALLMSVVFYLYSLIPFWNYAEVWGFGLALIFLLLQYDTFVYRKQLDATQIVLYMFGGLMASTLVGALMWYVFKLQPFNIWFDANRLVLFTCNPNRLHMVCLIIMSGLFFGVMKNKISWWGGMLAFCITMYMGTLTKSKTFMLCTAILLFFMLIVFMMRNKKVGLIFGGCLLGLVAILAIFFRNYVQFMIERFFIHGELTLESITTGRWFLWQSYLGELRKSPINLFFGMGAWCKTSIVEGHNGPHNMYIDFLYHYGLIGIVLLVLLIVAYRADSNAEAVDKSRYFIVKLEDMLPLLMCCMVGLVESILSTGTTQILIPLAILFLYNGSKRVINNPARDERVHRLKLLKRKNAKEKHNGNKI